MAKADDAGEECSSGGMRFVSGSSTSVIRADTAMSICSCLRCMVVLDDYVLRLIKPPRLGCQHRVASYAVFDAPSSMTPPPGASRSTC